MMMQAMNRSMANRRLRISTKTSTTPSVWFSLAFASMLVGFTLGFSSITPPSSFMTTTRLSATTKNYPPMSREEVQAMLDTVPVYTVTEPNQEGLVLVKENGNPNDIAYFFFSPDAANTVFSPLRKKQKEQQGSSGSGADWTVSAYPLGLVWFELVNDPEQKSQGVEYRLLPEPENLIGAQNLLREQQKQSKVPPNPKINDLFRSPFNDIPIFVDQFLRVQTAETDEDTRDRVPLYIGLTDLMDTCNKAIKASSGEYQAAMSAIDLRDLIEEMTREEGNSNDYRRAILVPPTPKAENESGNETDGNGAKTAASPPQTEFDAFDWEGKQNIYGKALNDNEEIITPTASNDWSD